MEEYSRSDQGPIAGGGTWYFLAFMLLLLATVAAFAMWDHVTPDRHLMLVVVPVLCAIPFAFLVSRATQVLRKIGRAELTTPYESLALGLPVTAIYTRPIKGDATLESVEAWLRLEEKVTRGSGKNKKTFTAIAQEQTLTPVTKASPTQIRIDLPIRIPDAGPPTALVDGVELQWMLHMRLRMRGCPHTRSSFELNVLPAVVKR